MFAPLQAFGIVLLLVSCVTARLGSSSGNQDQAMVSPLGLAPAPPSASEALAYKSWLGFDSPNCTAKCEGKPTAWNAECWGQYVFFCKSAPGTECSFWGMKCEGHWWVAPSTTDDSHVAVVCEGGFRSMGVREATCPKTGITWKKYHASGCLGTLAGKMSQSMESEAFTDTSQFQAGTKMAHRMARKMDSLSSDEVMHELQHWMDSSSDVSAGNTSHTFVAEGRCEGLSGQGRAICKADSTDPAAPVTDLPSLQASVHAALGDLDIPDTPPELKALRADGPCPRAAAAAAAAAAPAPAHTSIFSSLLGSVSASGRLSVSHGHADCVMECNGEPAWFHGMWPCWGNATLSCVSLGCASADAEEGSDAAGRQSSSHAGGVFASPSSESARAETEKVLGNLRNFVREVAEPKRDARAAAAARNFVSLGSGNKLQGSKPELSDWQMGFSVTCKGLWTGIFGRRCMGLTLEHSTAESPMASMDRWGICSGEHGVRTHHDKNGFCMGEMCKGKSVAHTTAVWHEASPDASRAAAAAAAAGIVEDGHDGITESRKDTSSVHMIHASGKESDPRGAASHAVHTQPKI